MLINKIGSQIKTSIRRGLGYTLAILGSMYAQSAFAADSPLPISTTEKATGDQGIIQLFQKILDNEVITFIVIFFAIVIGIGCLGGAYNAYKKYEEDEKLGKLIVGWIVCTIFFVLAGALLYILSQIKNFSGT